MKQIPDHQKKRIDETANEMNLPRGNKISSSLTENILMEVQSQLELNDKDTAYILSW